MLPDVFARLWVDRKEVAFAIADLAEPLGFDGIYLAGESGEIFGVPYDYCLQRAAADDSRCIGGGGESLPSDGAFLVFTGPFGSPALTPPAEIDPNDALAFSLYVRKGGDTELALIDSSSVTVAATPQAYVDVHVSGDRHFLTVVPRADFDANASGELTFALRGAVEADGPIEVLIAQIV